MKNKFKSQELFRALLDSKSKSGVIDFLKSCGAQFAPFEQFIAQMRTQGYNIVDMEWDGNCFFRAIAHQLNDGRDHNALRQLAADYIDQNGELSNFINSSDISQVRNNGFAADDLLINALARALNININIHRDDGTITPILTDPANQVFEIGLMGGHYTGLTAIEPTFAYNQLEQLRPANPVIVGDLMVTSNSAEPFIPNSFTLSSESSEKWKNDLNEYREQAKAAYSKSCSSSDSQIDLNLNQDNHNIGWQTVVGASLIATLVFSWWNSIDFEL